MWGDPFVDYFWKIGIAFTTEIARKQKSGGLSKKRLLNLKSRPKREIILCTICFDPRNGGAIFQDSPYRPRRGI